MRVAPVSADAEAIKLASNYLGGTIGEELANDRDDFDHDAELLLKFHGIYQQDDRDVRRARTQLKLPLDYSCMVRASVPGGVITTTSGSPSIVWRRSPTTSSGSRPGKACSTTWSTRANCASSSVGSTRRC